MMFSFWQVFCLLMIMAIMFYLVMRYQISADESNEEDESGKSTLILECKSPEEAEEALKQFMSYLKSKEDDEI